MASPDLHILLVKDRPAQPEKKLAHARIIYLIGIVLAAFAVYYPVFSHDFQQLWDDHWVAMNYYTEGGWGRDNVWIILTEFYHGQYAPVNEFYYLTLYSLFGYDPFWFHTGSLLIHICNGMLCYSLVIRLLEQSKQFTYAAVSRISFLTALLFTVHPFLTEGVAWISASKNIIYALFYLVALHFYLKYIQTGKYAAYALTLLFFIISFGGKEQAVTMPVCLVLFDYVLKRKLTSRKIWLEKTPFFVLALFFGIITLLSQAAVDDGALSGDKYYPLFQRIALAGYTLSEYFLKCVLPVKLSYIYPFPFQVGEPLPPRYYIYLLVVVIACIGFYHLVRKTWLFFGLAFFLIHIALVLNLITLSRFAIVADRYVYLASIGMFFTMAYLFNAVIERKGRGWKWWPLLALVYLLSLGIYANQRCQVWHNSDTLKAELRELLKLRNDHDNKKPAGTWDLPY